jgi:hypothetical protein
MMAVRRHSQVHTAAAISENKNRLLPRVRTSVAGDILFWRESEQRDELRAGERGAHETRRSQRFSKHIGLLYLGESPIYVIIFCLFHRPHRPLLCLRLSAMAAQAGIR